MLRFRRERRKVADVLPFILRPLPRSMSMTAPCPALGFRVTIEPRSGIGPSFEALVDDWTHFLEGRGLHCTGGGASERVAFVVASEASQATENDRVAARAWLSSRPDVSSCDVGDLEDLSREDP
jgi:uncharacterized protein YggL (DUF469 family)